MSQTRALYEYNFYTAISQHHTASNGKR